MQSSSSGPFPGVLSFGDKRKSKGLLFRKEISGWGGGVRKAKVCFEELPGVEERGSALSLALSGERRGGELSAPVVQPSPLPLRRALGTLSKMAPGLRGRVPRPSQGGGAALPGRGWAVPSPGMGGGALPPR